MTSKQRFARVGHGKDRAEAFGSARTGKPASRLFGSDTGWPEGTARAMADDYLDRVLPHVPDPLPADVQGVSPPVLLGWAIGSGMVAGAIQFTDPAQPDGVESWLFFGVTS